MKKSLAIFVHGINSDVSCWDALFKLFKRDPAITAAFDLVPFPYESKIAFGLFNPIQKIPEYGEIAKQFETFVEEKFTIDYNELYLVGHSQGGLVIQEWLVRRLNSGYGRDLRRVREVLMIASPPSAPTSPWARAKCSSNSCTIPRESASAPSIPPLPTPVA